MTDICESLHELSRTLEKFNFPFNNSTIPVNGVYLLFQKGEEGHNGDRIVRVGTHTGENQLKARLMQHFMLENKDRSIFRKNIGRSILNQNNDPFLNHWELDLTTKSAREKYSSVVNIDYQREIEHQVTKIIQNDFYFSVLEVNDKADRLAIEAKMISTVSLCSKCKPSINWLGLSSPKNKIVESGLWQVNELYKTPLGQLEIENLKNRS